jgi:2'-5' RNA ligase
MPDRNKGKKHSMYYLALVCPPELDQQIRQYKQWMKERFGCTNALKSPAHITLIAPFWLEEGREEKLQHLLTSFMSGEEALQICLNGFSHFGKQVLFINVEENAALEKLQHEVQDYFFKALPGIIKKEGRPFHPHITIATRDMKPGAFLEAWDYFSRNNYKAVFIAGCISLLKLEDGKWKVAGERDWMKKQ